MSIYVSIRNNKSIDIVFYIICNWGADKELKTYVPWLNSDSITSHTASKIWFDQSKNLLENWTEFNHQTKVTICKKKTDCPKNLKRVTARQQLNMDSVARTKANNRLHDCYINLYKTMIKLKNITQVEDIKQTE